MTDETALLRAILADPAEDTPRLILADWLDENAGTMPCSDCDGKGVIRLPRTTSTYIIGSMCAYCDGLGTVPDGRSAWAEFIRVQVELAQIPECQFVPMGQEKPCRESARPYSISCRSCTIHRRERELWERWADQWFDLMWSNHGILHGCRLTQSELDECSLPIKGFVSRGFVSAVTCTTAAFLGGPCPGCIEPGEQDDGDPRCKLCHGTGRTQGIARELFSQHPIEKITLSDMQPMESAAHLMQGKHWFFHWRTPAYSLLSAHLKLGKNVGNLYKVYQTRSVAINDLSNACVQYGRNLAGLPTM